MLGKRLLLAGGTLLLILGLTTAALAAGPAIKLLVNGREIRADVPPQIIKGRTMVPIRAVAEALNADVLWLPEEQIVAVNSLHGIWGAMVNPDDRDLEDAVATVAQYLAFLSGPSRGQRLQDLVSEKFFQGTPTDEGTSYPYMRSAEVITPRFDFLDVVKLGEKRYEVAIREYSYNRPFSTFADNVYTVIWETKDLDGQQSSLPVIDTWRNIGNGEQQFIW